MQLTPIVETIIEYEDKFLLIKRPAGVHAGGFLAFPGGKVDAEDGLNEQDILITAAKREALEEVGVDILDPLHYATSSTFEADGNLVLVAVFYTKLVKTSPVVTPSAREVPEYFWMTSQEVFKNADVPPWVKRYLAAAISVRS